MGTISSHLEFEYKWFLHWENYGHNHWLAFVSHPRYCYLNTSRSISPWVQTPRPWGNADSHGGSTDEVCGPVGSLGPGLQLKGIPESGCHSRAHLCGKAERISYHVAPKLNPSNLQFSGYLQKDRIQKWGALKSVSFSALSEASGQPKCLMVQEYFGSYYSQDRIECCYISSCQSTNPSLVVGRVHQKSWQYQEWLLSIPTAKEAFVTHIAGLLVRNGAYGEAVLARTRSADRWDSWSLAEFGITSKGEPSSGCWKNYSLHLQAETGPKGGALGSWGWARANVKLKLRELSPKSKYAVTQSVRRLAGVWLPYEVTCWHVLSNSLACLSLVIGIPSWVTITGPTAWLREQGPVWTKRLSFWGNP